MVFKEFDGSISTDRLSFIKTDLYLVNIFKQYDDFTGLFQI